MNTKHMPSPWRVHGLTVEGQDGNICLMNLAREEEQTEANAAFIVLACNAHYDLVEALEKAGVALVMEGCRTSASGALTAIASALAKAKQV